MDLAILTNAPREIAFAGKTYRVSALRLSEWGALQAFLKDHAINPVVAAVGQLAEAKAAGITVAEEDRKALLEMARMEAKPWPPPIGSALWFDQVHTVDGALAMFLDCVLRKHQPQLSDAEIAAANETATPDEARILIYRALGLDPAPKPASPAETAPIGGEPAPAPTMTGQAGSMPSASATD